MMKARRLLAVLLIGATVAAGWYVWRRHTTPVPPAVSLDGVFPEKAEKINQALDQARRNPRSGKAWGNLGMALLANGFPEEAIPCFAHAQRFDPTEPRWPYFHGGLLIMYSRPGGFDQLRTALAAARSSRDRATVLFELAELLIEDGQLDEAGQRVEEARAIDGENPRVDFTVGVLALNRGDRTTARARLGNLADHPAVRRKVCALLAGLVEDADLANDYRRRAESLPEDAPWPDSYLVELVRYRATPHQRLADYLELENQGRHDEALQMLRDLVARSPGEDACFTLGLTLMRRGQYEEAASAFKQAMEYGPDKSKIHLFRGACLVEAGDKRFKEVGGRDRALEMFREAVREEDRAIALNPTVADPYLTRGRALKYLGRNEEAIATFRQAVLVGSDIAEMHQALGEALAEAGQVREGLEHLRDAVRLAKPDDPKPKKALEAWEAKQKASP